MCSCVGMRGAHREVTTDDFSYEETVRRVPVIVVESGGGRVSAHNVVSKRGEERNPRRDARSKSGGALLGVQRKKTRALIREQQTRPGVSFFFFLFLHFWDEKADCVCALTSSSFRGNDCAWVSLRGSTHLRTFFTECDKSSP